MCIVKAALATDSNLGCSIYNLQEIVTDSVDAIASAGQQRFEAIDLNKKFLRTE